MKVAVVGIRGMGRSHIEAARKCSLVKDVVGCDINAEVRRTVGSAMKVETYADVGSLLRDYRPDAVFVATPPDHHGTVIRPCLEAGAAVLTEKPICSTLAESEEVVALARKLNVPMQVGFEVRYCGFMKAIEQVIAQGLLGQVNHISLIQLSGPHPGPYMTRQRTGGIFYEKLCHQVDTFRYLLGEPTRVSAIAAPTALKHYTVEDNVMASFEFAGGALGTITFDTRRAAQVNGLLSDKPKFEGWEAGHFYEFTFSGDKGTAVFDAWTNAVDVMRYNHRTDEMTELVQRIDISKGFGEAVYAVGAQADDFLQRVAAGQPLRFPASDALKTMRWVERAEESLRRRGQWISDNNVTG